MLIEKLKDIVGPAGWTADPVDLEPHLTEWRGLWRGTTALMVSPQTTDQVARIVAACSATGTAIVPQGGNTGLCGGAIPDESGDQVLLSLSRMSSIRALDAEDYSMVVEAGCILSDLQAAAAAAGRMFPLSLAAEGSCQIGGNLSTNAGGINVLRYGTARDQVLGLEVVLADGTIWDGLRSLRKDTAGYDLKQLFIGAEGTLGIITAATLKLYPAVQNVKTAFVAVPSAQSAVELLAALHQDLSDRLQAFELIPDRALRYVERHVPSASIPFDNGHPWYVLLESANAMDDETLERHLLRLLEASIASDAIVAKNAAEAAGLWHLRHSISEAQKKEGASLKHDVSVPVARIGEFIDAATSAVEQAAPGARVVAFGHVGDGNVHFNVSQPGDDPPHAFLAQRDAVASVVYDMVASFGGSISAEHGIGQGKREHLRFYRSETELDLMRTLKAALDPQHILNPGKVI